MIIFLTVDWGFPIESLLNVYGLSNQFGWKIFYFKMKKLIYCDSTIKHDVILYNCDTEHFYEKISAL